MTQKEYINFYELFHLLKDEYCSKATLLSDKNYAHVLEDLTVTLLNKDITFLTEGNLKFHFITESQFSVGIDMEKVEYMADFLKLLEDFNDNLLFLCDSHIFENGELLFKHDLRDRNKDNIRLDF